MQLKLTRTASGNASDHGVAPHNETLELQWLTGQSSNDKVHECAKLMQFRSAQTLCGVDCAGSPCQMLNHFLSPKVSIVSNDLCRLMSHHELRSSCEPWERTQAITSTCTGEKQFFNVPFRTLKSCFKSSDCSFV